MVDEVKRRAPNGSPELRRYSSAAKSPTITHRVRGGLYEKLKAEAEKNGLSLSEEIEKRLGRSFDAETLEAMLRRVMREEISAEREATRAVVLKRVTSFRFGNQIGFTGVNPVSGQAVGWPATQDEALAVMADAQH